MSAEGAGAAAVGIGIKTAVLMALGTAAVSVLAVVVGFTIIPLKPGDEIRDAGRRLAGGLFASFTLGPLAAFKVLEWFPGYGAMWQRLLGDGNYALAYLAASAPAIAVTGVLGFWIVAASMRWFSRRDGKDLGQLIDDARRVAPPKE